MSKLLSVVCLLLMSVVSFGQTFEIDTKDASVGFNYVSEKTKGSLKGVEAKVSIDGANLANATVTGSVDVSTLSTGNKTRDKHLKSPDFFDAKKFPKMSFTAESIVKEGEDLYANGKLTIKDVTKDVKFKVYEKEGTLCFKVLIYAADYGVAVKKNRDKSKVYVLVKLPLK